MSGFHFFLWFVFSFRFNSDEIDSEKDRIYFQKSRVTIFFKNVFGWIERITFKNNNTLHLQGVTELMDFQPYRTIDT
ncbi:MAG: hypothetical protein A2499_15355 [Stygiobacter sp. RIFOXYC12_FULL_38_8]|nr:MAG: hypothetical protein A2X62_13870 [Stygiobacter sp. GWC2_38_9]OGU81144.1 MAG: hypothetical protein A2279_02215 [Stygiobacter sp. RIFOXYA12_FULL_38_9]OGV09227.1 MAG: hypothetical protein A2299_08340 [Stygiobacter sp. RIFOXYB2_FULL_37_11]OGV09890.1 MAG: hypothetical protein A2237_07870 [Stygiobacter sp. RIFOXYA2_FULL_38_8]OGV15375.1 MAG: hypothetical protein A2440_08040 [Stygiobacter sp. RIFOXYC2_FULL_38_25]OGV27781.1 MAG: hypothetical protein A2499_15355 [Stygiobacter sp. RIFOXYC12_FULL_